MAALKVIQWATGTVGRHAMKAITDLPHLELVGALGPVLHAADDLATIGQRGIRRSKN